MPVTKHPRELRLLYLEVLLCQVLKFVFILLEVLINCMKSKPIYF